MDSANGFCLPRKCPLLIIKKQKNVFFLLFFITSSLLSNSRRKKGTAQIQPGPARERELVRDQTLLHLLSKGKWAASAAAISFCPSKQKTLLQFQTYLLNHITKLAALPDPCHCLIYVKVVKALRGLWTGKGTCVWEGAPPSLAPCHLLGGFGDGTNTTEEEDTQDYLAPLTLAGIILMHGWTHKGSCNESASCPRAHNAESHRSRLWTQLTVIQAAFQSNKPCIFPCSLNILLLCSAYCWWAIPAEGRPGKGEEPYIYYSLCLECSEQVKTNFLDY